MTSRMYQPEASNKLYLYIFIFSAMLLGAGIFVYTRSLTVEAECGEISLKTSGLTKSFDYDPLTSYETTKAKCLEDVLSKSK